MAVSVYPADCYAFWHEQYPSLALPGGIVGGIVGGMVGEHLTIWGLCDDTVCIGDTLQLESAQRLVTRPHMLCYTLDLRCGRDGVLKRHSTRGSTCFCFAVLQEGEVAVGGSVRVLHRAEHAVSVLDIVRLEREGQRDMELLRRAVARAALSPSWRDTLLKRLSEVSTDAS
jgi:MOSC domain-containing protein YiiM